MKKIAIEEHFYTESYLEYLRSRKEAPRLVQAGSTEKMHWTSHPLKMNQVPELMRRLVDLFDDRLRDMDENGVDMQVLSLSAPAAEAFEPEAGTSIARQANDELAEAIARRPDRFAGFAALAPLDPSGAAKELERTVRELGFKGALISSNIRGGYLDNQKFWPIFETAEKLGVPIYIHPTFPREDMLAPYLVYPELAFALWGFAADTSLHAVCLICSGVFDKYPGLKIVLGHLGEGLPLWLWRMDNHWLKMKERNIAEDPLAGRLLKTPSGYMKDNFRVTTSGMPWKPALELVYTTLGADMMLFSIDYPYESSREAIEAIESMSISDADKEKIFHVNAEKLLGL